MNIAVAAIVVVLVIIGIVVWNKNQQAKRLEEERLRKIAEEEERQRQLQLEEEARKAAKKAEIEAGKEIYHYMNQSIKTMFYHYRTEQWDSLTSLGQMEVVDSAAAVRCIDHLAAANKRLTQEFLACLDLDQNLKGSGEIKDSIALKAIFEKMMLPFFPVYYKEFSNGPRYISFLNQNVLKLFTQLSGKKFRLGYKNRYQNGQIAFEWVDDIYRVFDMNGKQLCDASFAGGKVKTGYAILPMEGEDDAWEICQKGIWENGSLVKEDAFYHYKVKI